MSVAAGIIRMSSSSTVFENRQKSRIQHCERSELRLHFEFLKNAQNSSFWLILEKSDSVTRHVIIIKRTKIGEEYASF